MGGGGFKIHTGDLKQSGSTMQNLGDKTAAGGKKMETIGQSLVSHAGNDKSGIGSVIAKAFGTGTQVVGKVFSEGGRVAGAAGKRLHGNANSHEANERDVTNSFKNIDSSKQGTFGAPKKGSSAGLPYPTRDNRGSAQDRMNQRRQAERIAQDRANEQKMRDDIAASKKAAAEKAAAEKAAAEKAAAEKAAAEKAAAEKAAAEKAVAEKAAAEKAAADKAAADKAAAQQAAAQHATAQNQPQVVNYQSFGDHASADNFMKQNYPGVQQINQQNYLNGTPGHNTNCGNCTVLTGQHLMTGQVGHANPSAVQPLAHVEGAADFQGTRFGGQFHHSPDYNTITNYMANQPPGTAGSVAVKWPNTTDGHFFNVYKAPNGQVHYLDGQTGLPADMSAPPSEVYFMQFQNPWKQSGSLP